MDHEGTSLVTFEAFGRTAYDEGTSQRCLACVSHVEEFKQWGAQVKDTV